MFKKFDQVSTNYINILLKQETNTFILHLVNGLIKTSFLWEYTSNICEGKNHLFESVSGILHT